ncbi:putative vitamin h protein [Botrytis fragariae]|uniref:Putative vitamin h protein n=1 Tax=Botrytis fragariae TaxID=1964551 RepID=A0A8H6AJZ2_9HELO|nr:putative vitamin h protein [Botrytis fragariae]KAF5869123.1 putative vitamin h protein [Botrytis fragariae]
MTSIDKAKDLSGDAVRTDSNASQAGKDTENMEIGEVYCHPTTAEEKALLRKIDWRLMPLLTASYFLQFLDKSSLNYASIMGLIPDTGLVGQEYSWLGSAFYFGYLIANYPASLGFIKFPLAKFLSVSIVIWAIVLGCHGAANNFVGLCILRVLLGITESTVSPGFSLLTGIWYKPSEHAWRHGIWFLGNGIANTFGGLLAYGIAHIGGRLGSWRWLFIIFGLITIAWGVLLYFTLPDAPLTARFLTQREREIADRRPQKTQHSFKTNKWSRSQCIEALLDPKTWLISLIIAVTSITNGVVSNFGSLIIKSFGFGQLDTILLGIPNGGFQIAAVIAATYTASKVRRSRLIIIVVGYIFALVGILLVKELPTSNRYGRLVGCWMMILFSSAFPLLLSLMASNTAGFTKKTTVNAIFFIGYCAGNIGGPQLFKSAEAPNYHTAYNGMIACLAISIVLSIILRQYMDRENKRRDREQGVYIDPEPKHVEDIDDVDLTVERVVLTDWENKGFRYYL